MAPPQARYWMLTIPQNLFTPYLPQSVAYIKGQLELGEGGFLHWQLVAVFRTKTRLAGVRKVFGAVHSEPTRSEAAMAYVWKEDTRVCDTQFELGVLPFKRNEPTDWERVRELAKVGDLDAIPGDVYIRCYNSLKRIAADHLEPTAGPRTVTCIVGESGYGKTYKAFAEAGPGTYWKDSSNKWWDGYRGQKHVLIDEFTGGVDLAAFLRWTDIFPVTVETKGGTLAGEWTHIWITTNIEPVDWYPNALWTQKVAITRRMTIVRMDRPWNAPAEE